MSAPPRYPQVVVVMLLLVGPGLAGLGSDAEAAARRANGRAKAASPVADTGARKGKVQSRAGAKALAKAKERARADARAKADAAAIAAGKVAVFDFKGDDTEPVRRQVVRLLKGKGLDVTTTLRPVDSAEQYRDMAATLGLAVYVHGEIKDTSQDQAIATVHVRSGVTGRRIASATVRGQRRTLPSDMEDVLWTRVGPAFTRACVAAAKPRRRHNAPMRIEAGTPIETTPRSEEGT